MTAPGFRCDPKSTANAEFVTLKITRAQRLTLLAALGRQVDAEIERHATELAAERDTEAKEAFARFMVTQSLLETVRGQS